MTKAKEAKTEQGLVGRLFETIGAIFKPILVIIIGAGILQALRDVLLMVGVVDQVSSSYIFLDGMGNAAFYFLPIFLAISSAQVFGAQPFLAGAVAAFLLYPNVVNLFEWAKAVGWDLTIFGVVPIADAKYPSSVLPIILIIWFQSKIEPIIQKIVPDILKSIFYPVLTLFVTSFMALVVLGPIGTLLGDLIAGGIMWVNDRASWLVPTIIGALSPFLVMTGAHYSLFPVATQNLAQLGYDTVLMPGMMASNMALAGMSIAVAVRAVSASYKSYSFSSGITSMFGISQSSLYGNAIPLKKPLIASVVGGGVGGFVAGLLGIHARSFVTPGILAFVGYLTSATETVVSNQLGFWITVAVSFAAGFLLTIIFGFEQPTAEEIAALQGEAATEEEKEVAVNEDEEATRKEREAFSDASEKHQERTRKETARGASKLTQASSVVAKEKHAEEMSDLIADQAQEKKDSNLQEEIEAEIRRQEAIEKERMKEENND